MNENTKLFDTLGELQKIREQLDPGLFVSAILAALAAAFLASLMYRFFYERRGTGSQVHRAFPLLAISITTLFIGVQISIPLSLGLLGSLSIIRFRTPIKEPEEVGFIMLVIAASVSAATFNFGMIAILYIAAFISLLAARGAAALRWLRRDGIIVLSISGEGQAAEQKDAEDKLRESVSKLVLESASSRGGSDTYQYVFSGLKCSVGELRAQLSGIPGISSVNVFLDKPGGIR